MIATDSKFLLKPGGRLLLLFTSVAALAMLSLVAASPSRAQEYGYSYLRIDVAGHPVTNFPTNEKYQGWIQIESVEERLKPGVTVKTYSPSGDKRWAALQLVLQKGRAGPGKLRFGAGDTMGIVIGRKEYTFSLDPLLDAQKRQAFIRQADLALYDENTAGFIGSFRIKGIRILSLENVQASACPMYEITVSFQSISKE